MYIKSNFEYYIHAVNKNGGAEVIAPAEVLGVISSITLAWGLS